MRRRRCISLMKSSKVAPFDDPAAVTLTFHVFTAEQLPWLEIADALPRYEHGSRDAIPVSHGPRPPAAGSKTGDSSEAGGSP